MIKFDIPKSSTYEKAI